MNRCEMKPIPHDNANRGRPGHRVLIGLLTLAGLTLGGWYARDVAGWWMRYRATQELDAGAIGRAQWYLARAARWEPENGTTDLIRAACYRQLQEDEAWRQAVEAAERKGVPAANLELERKLYAIRSGNLQPGDESLLADTPAKPVSEHDVPTAFVHGYLAGDNPRMAKMLLDAWSGDRPDEPQLAYMWAVNWQAVGEPALARKQLDKALQREPRHELARTALADLLEQQNRLREALDQYLTLVGESGGSERAALGLARLLRKLACPDRACDVLGPLAAASEPSAAVAAEMGQIELELGNPDAAIEWFARAEVEQTDNTRLLSAAGRALALVEENTRAEWVFARVIQSEHQIARMYNLQVRLAVDANDRGARDELQRLRDSASRWSSEHGLLADNAGDSAADDEAVDRVARELYLHHCKACHGADGDGDGRAALYLFPRPRDFRNDRFQLVSTRNGVPTLDDLVAVIRRGMPGTSMRAYEDLSDEHLAGLAQEVMRMHREGTRDRIVAVFAADGEKISPAEAAAIARGQTTPGPPVEVPEIGPATAEAIARGRDLYVRQTCNACHGDEGVGVRDVPLVDMHLQPTRPRDLVHELFEGGSGAEAVFLRIVAGMPGTPHPASPSLADDEVVDLVHYCLSLLETPKLELTNYQRAALDTGSAYLRALGQDFSANSADSDDFLESDGFFGR